MALMGSRGVVAQRREAQRRGRELASGLKPNREDGNHDVPLLIGITQDTGGGSCIVEIEKVAERKSINGTRFDAGDYAISVKWWVNMVVVLQARD